MSGLLVVGIDPGLTGAVGILNPDGGFHCYFDLPVIRDKSLAWIDGQALTSSLLKALDGKAARVIIERVSSMPGQGVASSFGFGVTFGSILAAVQVLRLPIELVTPSVWKRDLSLGRDKHAALHRARMLFPICDLSLTKHDGRAEALLLAHWALNRASQRAAA